MMNVDVVVSRRPKEDGEEDVGVVYKMKNNRAQCAECARCRINNNRGAVRRAASSPSRSISSTSILIHGMERGMDLDWNV